MVVNLQPYIAAQLTAPADPLARTSHPGDVRFKFLRWAARVVAGGASLTLTPSP